MRARRLVSVAAIAAVGVLATACRSHPEVAAYIGDQEVTEAQVSEVVEDLRQKLGEDPTVPLPPRSQVVTVLVLNNVCEQVSAEKGYRPQAEYPVEFIVEQSGLPADSAYVRHSADLQTCLSGFPAAQAVAPTEDELTDLVARAKAAGAVPAEVTFNEAVAQLDGEQLRRALGQRQAFTEAMAGYDITVNPRYRPLELPLLVFQDRSTAVGVPIGEHGSEAVIDQR
ncbi:MAG TPA: hypothetical protein VF174_13870 [Micromonosporaceae bacterium]